MPQFGKVRIFDGIEFKSCAIAHVCAVCAAMYMDFRDSELIGQTIPSYQPVS